MVEHPVTLRGASFAVAGGQPEGGRGQLAAHALAQPSPVTQLGEQLDFDSSAAFCGREDLSMAADALHATLLDIASGQATWGEVLSEGDEILSRYAPAL